MDPQLFLKIFCRVPLVFAAAFTDWHAPATIHGLPEDVWTWKIVTPAPHSLCRSSSTLKLSTRWVGMGGQVVCPDTFRSWGPRHGRSWPGYERSRSTGRGSAGQFRCTTPIVSFCCVRYSRPRIPRITASTSSGSSCRPLERPGDRHRAAVTARRRHPQLSPSVLAAWMGLFDASRLGVVSAVDIGLRSVGSWCRRGVLPLRGASGLRTRRTSRSWCWASMGGGDVGCAAGVRVGEMTVVDERAVQGREGMWLGQGLVEPLLTDVDGQQRDDLLR